MDLLVNFMGFETPLKICTLKAAIRQHSFMALQIVTNQQDVFCHKPITVTVLDYYEYV